MSYEICFTYVDGRLICLTVSELLVWISVLAVSISVAAWGIWEADRD